MNHQRIIAVEEHVATEEYLQIAHRLDVTAADRTEVGLMRTVETGPSGLRSPTSTHASRRWTPSARTWRY